MAIKIAKQSSNQPKII